MLLILVFCILFSLETANPGKSIAEVNSDLSHLIRFTIDQKKAARIDSFFSAKYRRHNFNGTVLYAEKGRTIFKGAFGYANYKNRDTLTTNSAFQLGSVSKPLTSFAILLLVEKKKLSLNDPIEKFFPDFPYKKITIRMLLSHRSGLPNYLYFSDKLWPDPKPPISNQEVIKLMIKYKPRRLFRPNQRYNYSNTNYCILAAILEKLCGISFENFMEKNIFKPLEMTNTHIFKKGVNMEIPGKVTGYNRKGRIADNTYLNGVVGDKGVYSTVEDLEKWDTALYQGKLVSREMLKEAFEPAKKNRRHLSNYGLGWRITRDKHGEKIVYHSGWWKGFKAHLVRKPDTRRTIIVLMNSVSGNHVSLRELEALL